DAPCRGVLKHRAVKKYLFTLNEADHYRPEKVPHPLICLNAALHWCRHVHLALFYCLALCFRWVPCLAVAAHHAAGIQQTLPHRWRDLLALDMSPGVTTAVPYPASCEGNILKSLPIKR